MSISTNLSEVINFINNSPKCDSNEVIHLIVDSQDIDSCENINLTAELELFNLNIFTTILANLSEDELLTNINDQYKQPQEYQNIIQYIFLTPQEALPIHINKHFPLISHALYSNPYWSAAVSSEISLANNENDSETNYEASMLMRAIELDNKDLICNILIAESHRNLKQIINNKEYFGIELLGYYLENGNITEAFQMIKKDSMVSLINNPQTKIQQTNKNINLDKNAIQTALDQFCTNNSNFDLNLFLILLKHPDTDLFINYRDIVVQDNLAIEKDITLAEYLLNRYLDFTAININAENYISHFGILNDLHNLLSTISTDLISKNQTKIDIISQSLLDIHLENLLNLKDKVIYEENDFNYIAILRQFLHFAPKIIINNHNRILHNEGVQNVLNLFVDSLQLPFKEFTDPKFIQLQQFYFLLRVNLTSASNIEQHFHPKISEIQKKLFKVYIEDLKSLDIKQVCDVYKAGALFISYDENGLNDLIENNSIEVIELILNIIKSLNLSPKELFNFIGYFKTRNSYSAISSAIETKDSKFTNILLTHLKDMFSKENFTLILNSRYLHQNKNPDDGLILLSSLQASIYQGNIETIKLILLYLENLNLNKFEISKIFIEEAKFRGSLIHYTFSLAIESGNLEVIKLLINFIERYNLSGNELNNIFSINKILYFSILSKNIDIFSYLLNYIATSSISNDQFIKLLNYDNDKLLLSVAIDKDNAHQYKLILNALKIRKISSNQILQFLEKQYCIFPNLLSKETNRYSDECNLLIQAIYTGNNEFIIPTIDFIKYLNLSDKQLLKLLNISNGDNKTALQIASIYSQSDTIKYLQELVNQRNLSPIFSLTGAVEAKILTTFFPVLKPIKDVLSSINSFFNFSFTNQTIAWVGNVILGFMCTAGLALGAVIINYTAKNLSVKVLDSYSKLNNAMPSITNLSNHKFVQALQNSRAINAISRIFN